MTDRIPTTAPDPTAIEEALLRITAVADIVSTVGEVLRGANARHSNTLILMSTDLADIRPVAGHLMAKRGTPHETP